MTPLRFKQDITFGCNIGVLFVKGGRVVKSGDILAGKQIKDDDEGCYRFIPKDDQAKIDVKVSTCRAVTGDEIHYALRNIRKIASNKGVKVFMEPVRGIKPTASLNLIFSYEEERQDPTLLAIRDAERIVPMLDILLGNTSVLVGGGQSKNAMPRRWRMNKFGIEYCLPNFWYKSYPLASFAMGLARLAVNIAAQSTKDQDYVKAFMSAVNLNDVRRAIRDNNAALAYENFKKIEPLILELTADNDENYPLVASNIKDFHFFLEKGIDHWFKRWSFSSAYNGWERFLSERVHRQRPKAESWA